MRNNVAQYQETSNMPLPLYKEPSCGDPFRRLIIPEFRIRGIYSEALVVKDSYRSPYKIQWSDEDKRDICREIADYMYVTYHINVHTEPVCNHNFHLTYMMIDTEEPVQYHNDKRLTTSTITSFDNPALEFSAIVDIMIKDIHLILPTNPDYDYGMIWESIQVLRTRDMKVRIINNT